MAGRRTRTSARTRASRFVLGDLEVALAIGRAGTLSGAARDLSVERTTVGRRLASLEEDLSVRLFHRTPDGFVPTEAGESVLEHARHIEEHALALERSVRGGDSRVAGTVRITALDPFIDDFLLPHLGALTDAHPGLTVIAAADTRVLSLSRREADIAIRYEAPRHPDHVGRRLASVGSALYGSNAYLRRRGTPRSPRELAGHDLVGLAPELASATEEQWIARHGRGARVVVRATTPATQRAAIRMGLGLGVHACHAAERERGVVRVGDEVLLRETYWAVVHVDMARSARVRAVLDFLSDLAAKERDRLEGARPGAKGPPARGPRRKPRRGDG
jgi:DNA-binding transcriptional LysR family regulator